MPPPVLAALLEKYRELVRLRRGDSAEHARAELRGLATRFPGALRELDEQPLEVLVAREAALVAVLAGHGPVPDWATWSASYHGWLRVGLRMKRARRDEALDAAAHAASAVHRAQFADEPATVSVADARALLSPPGKRLAAWVLRRVASAHGASELEVARALFVRPPRR